MSEILLLALMYTMMGLLAAIVLSALLVFLSSIIGYFAALGWVRGQIEAIESNVRQQNKTREG
jgi:biopolymer transport protein ExbB/TolQ